MNYTPKTGIGKVLGISTIASTGIILPQTSKFLGLNTFLLILVFISFWIVIYFLISKFLSVHSQYMRSKHLSLGVMKANKKLNRNHTRITSKKLQKQSNKTKLNSKK